MSSGNQNEQEESAAQDERIDLLLGLLREQPRIFLRLETPTPEVLILQKKGTKASIGAICYFPAPELLKDKGTVLITGNSECLEKSDTPEEWQWPLPTNEGNIALGFHVAVEIEHGFLKTESDSALINESRQSWGGFREWWWAHISDIAAKKIEENYPPSKKFHPNQEPPSFAMPGMPKHAAWCGVAEAVHLDIAERRAEQKKQTRGKSQQASTGRRHINV